MKEAASFFSGLKVEKPSVRSQPEHESPAKISPAAPQGSQTAIHNTESNIQDAASLMRRPRSASKATSYFTWSASARSPRATALSPRSETPSSARKALAQTGTLDGTATQMQVQIGSEGESPLEPRSHCPCLSAVQSESDQHQGAHCHDDNNNNNNATWTDMMPSPNSVTQGKNGECVKGYGGKNQGVCAVEGQEDEYHDDNNAEKAGQHDAAVPAIALRLDPLDPEQASEQRRDDLVREVEDQERAKLAPHLYARNFHALHRQQPRTMIEGPGVFDDRKTPVGFLTHRQPTIGLHGAISTSPSPIHTNPSVHPHSSLWNQGESHRPHQQSRIQTPQRAWVGPIETLSTHRHPSPFALSASPGPSSVSIVKTQPTWLSSGLGQSRATSARPMLAHRSLYTSQMAKEPQNYESPISSSVGQARGAPTILQAQSMDHYNFAPAAGQAADEDILQYMDRMEREILDPVAGDGYQQHGSSPLFSSHPHMFSDIQELPGPGEGGRHRRMYARPGMSAHMVSVPVVHPHAEGDLRRHSQPVWGNRWTALR